MIMLIIPIGRQIGVKRNQLRSYSQTQANVKAPPIGKQPGAGTVTPGADLIVRAGLQAGHRIKEGLIQHRIVPFASDSHPTI